MIMFYYPLQAEKNAQAALRFERPNTDWEVFSDNVKQAYPNCTFRLCFKGEDVECGAEYLQALLEKNRSL